MCGIAGGRAGTPVASMLAAIRHRGPDGVYRRDVGAWSLGAVRLAVQDTDERSASPMTVGSVTLAYNGELWNTDALRLRLARLGRTFRTTGDTEVVATALDEWGIRALPELEGMFALAWSDGDALWLARDRFGEVPLHATAGGTFASETKALTERSVLVDAGSLWEFRPSWPGPLRGHWYSLPTERYPGDREAAALELRSRIMDACAERAVSDIPVCTLLSGGIDSSAIAFGLSRLMPGLVAYTAVMDRRSPDVRATREVADALELRLVEVEIPAPSADDLRRVIAAIEMPYKAQVEIGWPCLVLAERMAGDGFRVTFSGEGSDELWASYGFAFHGVREHGWFPYRRRLFGDQARKNFPRANKAFMASGVECRLPFLHTRLVEFALSLPEDVVRERSRPKAVLADALADALPRSVLTRAKLAFQDGLGMKRAAADAVADPRRFYRAEHERSVA